VCLDDDCKQLSINQDAFQIKGDSSTRYSQSVISCDKMGSAEEWELAILTAYSTHNVPEADETPIPMEGECFSGACPAEKDWCKTDPECSESPYTEPEGSVKSGAIAGFTVAGIALLIAVLHGLHVLRATQQAKRYKTKFAERMAAKIDLRASMRQMAPEALAREFKKIDSETQNCHISKEALWNFLSTGKAGELSESDFDGLFAAIDLDQSGTVDFWEFCTFMGKCSDEYRSVRGYRGSVADRASRRISVADVTARRLSYGAPGTDEATKAGTITDATKAVSLDEGDAEDEEY
jgi:hypothetical protein